MITYYFCGEGSAFKRCYLYGIITVVTGGNVYVLDLAAKLDQCAEYLCKQQWGDIEFPPPFGREAYPEV